MMILSAHYTPIIHQMIHGCGGKIYINCTVDDVLFNQNHKNHYSIICDVYSTVLWVMCTMYPGYVEIRLAPAFSLFMLSYIVRYLNLKVDKFSCLEQRHPLAGSPLLS